jgi:hypothetical protein
MHALLSMLDRASPNPGVRFWRSLGVRNPESWLKRRSVHVSIIQHPVEEFFRYPRQIGQFGLAVRPDCLREPR